MISSTSAARSKTSSSLLAKWLKTVCFDTPAASATSPTVTWWNPRSVNSCAAASAIAVRVSAFLRSRSDMARPYHLTLDRVQS